MRHTIILRYIGMSLLMVSVLMLAATAVSYYHGTDKSTVPLIISAAITFITGIAPLLFVRSTNYVNARERYAIIAGAWISVCFFGMLPYLLYGGEFTFVNALFESVSGFTTTGATILNDIEALPLGLLFWRAVTAWIGGIGIVTIFSLMIPLSHDGKSLLSGAEISDIARRQVSLRGNAFIKSMLIVYSVLTAGCFLALRATGMHWFDALTNAMSTCSTCGFCIRNSSIAYYGSNAAEAVTICFMVLSGISFVGIYNAVFNKGLKQLFKSQILRTYLIFIAIGIIVMSTDLMLRGGYTSYTDALRDSAFQMCSITTTTGFATADTTLWPPLSIIILLVASIICGCAGSTSGGIKMDRIVILMKKFRIGIQSIAHPNWIQAVRVDDRVIKENQVSNMASFVRVYLSLIFIGAVFNAVAGLDLMTGVTAAIACVGNVGPGFGDVGSFGNYAGFSDILKYGSMVMMLAGRLEITPLLFMLINLFDRR